MIDSNNSDAPENEGQFILAEISRRFSQFVPTKEDNIAVRAVGRGTEIAFLNGSEKDLSLNRFTDRVVCDLGFRCSFEGMMTIYALDVDDLWWDPERQEAKVLDAVKKSMESMELEGKPVNQYESLSPVISINATPAELLEKLNKFFQKQRDSAAKGAS